ncbi:MULTISPECIES: hypothetical protein [Marivita]|uniref:Uncharacterized protein n=1 Tax=Marivita cryptomonadis TaxID=505252 RepID=A0A9Q2NWD2_9RHOB|nr:MULTISPECIES: hypothetical protein [Marivita]MCR9168879.1 hypothetical protein [Paracoccaceae bacterium]MBM2322420.1 hypothetical protein [Marivita cryptomonadis]MBM2332002.1 hypothetical protein [Marivita cryptomonadis]MBM2341586.1 hypothetical protein [Marivita cryptomonadis]MBM2346250.1 hypothetical protein [Marivita cryptomonadis]
MSAATGPLPHRFKACPADGIRAEFGVCRGDPIHHIQDLILGDTFLPKRDARWLAVTTDDADHEKFTLAMAANAPHAQLVTLAELIFMSITGQRIDVYAAVCNGQLYFVSETGFRTSVEYILIDIQRREDAVVPAILPTDDPAVMPMTRPHAPQAAKRTLRLIG